MSEKSRMRILVFISFLVFHAVFASSQNEKILTREELIEDARQLVRILETAHPDPYVNSGGKIAFHRRFQKMLRSLPREGMTAKAFFRLVSPFVAALRDGHTALLPPRGNTPPSPGLPFVFKVIKKDLYIANTCMVEGTELLGARLISLEGIPFDKLKRHQNDLRGIENDYGTLALLTRTLMTKDGLENLLPDWKDRNVLHVGLQPQSGKERDFTLSLEGKQEKFSEFPASRVRLPSMDKSDIAFCFLGEDRETALIKIQDMMTYRECGESWLADGMSAARDFIQEAYSKFHRKNPPDDIQKALLGLPSATEIFKDLVIAMKEAGTENLIVDLRDNTGGNSLMIPIFLYFLFGDEVMKGYDEGYSIKKYSDPYFMTYATDSLDKVNKDRRVPLMKNDYDFQDEFGEREDSGESLKKSPTFMKVYEAGKYNRYYTPDKILVLSSPLTYSSGFNMMSALSNVGAILIGTPSAQPGNNFGDSLVFQLKNSGIAGGVSHKRIISFPDDPDKPGILSLHHTLTYEKLASYGFDPNSEVLLALEILNSEKLR